MPTSIVRFVEELPDRTILVVEDEPLLRVLISGELSDAGYVVLEAENADEAIMLLDSAADRIAMIFTDVRMPGAIDGLALARHVAKQFPWIDIVVTSGNARPTTTELPSGGRFLPKPYLAADIVALAHALLNRGTELPPYRLIRTGTIVPSGA